MNPVPVSVTLGLAVALFLSLAGVGILGHQYLAVRDELSTSNTRLTQATDDAKACSDGVDALKAAGDAREQAANSARDKAQAVAALAQKNAQKLLLRAPTVPGNDCASAKAQVDDWLSTRVHP